MMKMLNLEVMNDDGNVFWVNSETGQEVLMSTKRNKYGTNSDRILLLKENSLLFPQFNYLARVDCSCIDLEESVIGAAIVNDKIIVQINSAGDMFQLVRDYKPKFTKEQYEKMKVEYNL